MTQILIALIAGGALVWLFATRERKNAGRAKHSMAWLTSNDELEQPEKKESQAQEKKDLDYSEINRAYRIADMHFSRGDFSEAEKWFIKVLALHEAHPESLNCLGIIYIQQNNPRRAELLYRKLLSITQKEPTFYCNYGRCLYNQKRLGEALEAYENAIKLDCTKPQRFVSVAQIHYEQKDFQKALAYFVKALDLEPINIDYLTQAAQLAELAGDKEVLLRSLKKIVGIDPYNEAAKKKLSTLLPAKESQVSPEPAREEISAGNDI